MAGVLKSPQFAEQNRMAQVNITAGGIDAELDAQRTALATGFGQSGPKTLLGIKAGAGLQGGWKQIGQAPAQPGR